MANLIGQQLGNYRIIRLLGSGGMGEVYLGENIHIGKYVAIKVLHGIISQQDKEDFKNEARIIATLAHPNIISLTDFGEYGKTFYMVMDYARNGSLRDRHATGSQLPFSTVISYVKQIASGLQYAHDHKIVHRDIKPANIFIGNNNEILIGDFGIAVPAHRTQSMPLQIPIGTPGYAAPEQYQGKARPASDQYALGVVIYEWLTGTLPSFPLPANIPAIPPAIEKVISKALAKDYHQRFASVQEFANTLEQASQPQQSLISPKQPNPSPLSIASKVPTVISPSQGTLLGTYRGHSDKVIAVAWSPNGQYLASNGSDQKVQIWDTKIGKHVLTVSYRPVQNRASIFSRVLPSAPAMPVFITVIAWSPHKEHFAVGYNNGMIEVWKVSTGQAIFTYQCSHEVYDLSWSPNGELIAAFIKMPTGNYSYQSRRNMTREYHFDKQIEVCEVTTAKSVFMYKFSAEPLMAWSPDGERIALSSYKVDNTVQVWNAVTGGKVFTYQHAKGVRAIAWSPSGAHLATANKSTAQIWDTITGKSILSYNGHREYDNDRMKSISASLQSITKHSTMTAIAWSPDGNRIASTDNGKIEQNVGYRDKQKRFHPAIHIWDVHTGVNLYTYLGHSSPVENVAWLADMQHIISRGQNVLVWNSISGDTVFTYSDSNPIVLLSPNEKHIATVSDEKTLQLWEATTGKHLLTYTVHPNKVTAIAWSPDGKCIATGANDGMVRVWKAV